MLRPPQIAFSTATRLPVEHARMLLPSRLSGATQFKRGPSPAAPSPLAPGTLPRLGSDGVFRRDPSPKPPPATAKALQRWPAPTSTYNTFP